MTSTQTWTVERVKDRLPNVEILTDDGHIYHAKIVGRLNQFATARICGKPWAMEVAWETVADCLNNGVPIRA